MTIGQCVSRRFQFKCSKKKKKIWQPGVACRAGERPKIVFRYIFLGMLLAIYMAANGTTTTKQETMVTSLKDLRLAFPRNPRCAGDSRDISPRFIGRTSGNMASLCDREKNQARERGIFFFFCLRALLRDGKTRVSLGDLA